MSVSIGETFIQDVCLYFFKDLLMNISIRTEEHHHKQSELTLVFAAVLIPHASAVEHDFLIN